MQLRFLDKFRERQKPRSRHTRKEIRVAVGKGLEFEKVLIHFRAQLICCRVSLRDTRDRPVFANVCSPPNPVCEQRVQRVAIHKNQIGKSRLDRLQDASHYLWRSLPARKMPDCGMAAIDHRRRTWMQTNCVPKIFRSFSNVREHQFIDISPSGAEKSNQIGRPVVLSPHIDENSLAGVGLHAPGGREHPYLLLQELKLRLDPLPQCDTTLLPLRYAPF